jgi:hypothetical protein
MTETLAVPNIYTAINAVMNEVGYVKKTKAPNLTYTFAGEAGLIAALRPEMVANGIFMAVSKISNVITREYATSKGTAMVNVALVGTVRFYHVGGTFIEVESAGEGSDTGDKATAKAMTAMYKYALRETFLIETGDDPDKYASDERPAHSNGNNRPATTGNGTPPAPADDSATIATANWDGLSTHWATLRNAAVKAGIKDIPTLEPGKATRGEVRTAYAELKAQIDAALQTA